MAESPRPNDGVGLEELKTLLVQALEDNARLKRENAELRDEIARLKGLNGRPKLRPSGMEQATGPTPRGERRKGRRGKTRTKVTVTETQVVKAEGLPAGARFKGYEEFLVQDLIVAPRTVLYRRERWQLADGRTVVAPLPAGTTSHFGPGLKRFVLAQYHQGQTTIPRLLALLDGIGIAISKRQLGRLLSAGQDAFLAEAQAVLRTGLESAGWITVDDTGARHKARNGVCTHIGNDRFASFATTGSKSRLNFLELLCAGATEIEWPEDEEKPTKYWLSTLRENTTFMHLVQMVKLRWRIERDYLELKQEIGLGHFEGRGWRGFHHHATLCIAAYGFLVSERAGFSPSATLGAWLFEAPRLPEDFRPRGAADAHPASRSGLARDPAP